MHGYQPAKYWTYGAITEKVNFRLMQEVAKEGIHSVLPGLLPESDRLEET